MKLSRREKKIKNYMTWSKRRRRAKKEKRGRQREKDLQLRIEAKADIREKVEATTYNFLDWLQKN